MSKFIQWIVSLFKKQQKPAPVPIPAPQPSPEPTKPTAPAVVTPTPICGCPEGKGEYVRKNENGTVVREVIVTGYLSCELRALLNDGTDKECGVADIVKQQKAARIVDGKLYVDCFMLPDGSKAHYIGSRQPSSGSPLVRGQGVPVGSGLLRLYFEGRR
ncbi:hypothetical protein CCP3SC15_1110001 [Gammaproteobacteria bacterium]